MDMFIYHWRLAWRILSITLLAWEMSTIVQWFEHCLVVPFLGVGMKTDLFQSCGHCWVSQICWHIDFMLQLYKITIGESWVKGHGTLYHFVTSCQFLITSKWQFIRKWFCLLIRDQMGSGGRSYPICHIHWNILGLYISNCFWQGINSPLYFSCGFP